MIVASYMQRVVEKENQLHLALNQLDAYKVQLRNSEATKAEALRDLDEAKRTLQDVAAQIGSINKSEQAAVQATQAASGRAKQIQDHQPPGSIPAAICTHARQRRVDTQRDHYIASAAELNSVKQQLSQLRQDFDAAMEAKAAAIQKASRAQNAAVVNRERVIELSKEVSTLREALAKLTSLHSQEDHATVLAAKHASLKSLLMANQEAELKMHQELDPDLTKHLKAKLDQTNKEIEDLREQLKNARTADLNAWNTAASELETAKKAMQEVVALENSLRTQVDSLQQELENNPDKYQPKLKNNPSSSKEEVRATIKDDSDYVASKILQLTSEAEVAIREAEEMKKCAESLRKEAEIARIAAKEAEEKLESVLKEARATNRLTDNAIHYSSTTAQLADPAAISKLNGKIKLSTDEYQSLKKKIELTKEVPESKSKRISITSCRSGCFN